MPSHRRSKKLRVRKSQPFRLALSSPIPGRPKVFWAYGSNTNIILEFWPERHSTNLLQKGPRRSFGFDTPKKIVIYEKNRPNIRALYFLRRSETRAKPDIVRGCFEWDGVISRSELRNSLGLLDEFIRLEWRGRPREDVLAGEALQLKKKGLSWARIAHELKTSFGVDTNREAIRKLVGTRKQLLPSNKSS